MTAERIVDAVRAKLSEVVLDLEHDIISIVTDGASVMKKFGRLIPCEHNLCYAHTIHLAVCDVLYKKKSSETDESQDEDTITEDNDDFELDENKENLSETFSIGEHDEDDENFDAEINCILGSSTDVDINAAIQKVRKIVQKVTPKK